MPLATMSDPSIAQSAARGFLAGSSFTVPLSRLVPSLNASHLPDESIRTEWPFTSAAGFALPLATLDTFHPGADQLLQVLFLVAGGPEALPSPSGCTRFAK